MKFERLEFKGDYEKDLYYQYIIHNDLKLLIQKLICQV